MTPMHVRPFDEPRPRLICRVARQWHALFPQHQLSHLSSCASCRSAIDAGRSLEISLRQDAFERREEVGTTDRLERDILRAIRVAGPAPGPTYPKWVYKAWTLGGLGAIAAAVVLVAGLRREPIGEERGVAVRPVASAPTQPATAEVAVIIETVDSLSTEFVERVLPSAGGLVANNPLQQEFTSVYSDVRSALDFLALNFLPTAPATSATPSRRI